MARRNKGEGSISVSEKKGEKYYKASVTIGYDADGKQIRKSFGSYDKNKVIDQLNTIKYEVKNKLREKEGDIKFGKLFLDWVETYKRNEIQNNTLDGYYTTYNLHIKPYSIAGIKASQVSLDILQRYFNGLQATCTPNNIRKIYTKINSCLNFAEISNIISKNFCKGVILPRIQKNKDDYYKVFTKKEQQQIIEKLNLKDVIDMAIYFTFYTGLRLGEVLAVRWERIEGNMYKVREQYQRDTIFLPDGKKKTIYVFKNLLKTPYAERDMPIPDKVLEFLNTVERVNSLIFCDRNGNPIERKKPDRRIKKICRELGIDDSRTFHSIRHTYCTRLFEAGVPIKTVQILMGHKDMQTTMNIYTHVTEVKKLEVLDVLNKI